MPRRIQGCTVVADAHCVSQAFLTPLHHAARGGHTEVATLLLEQNADAVHAKSLVRTACCAAHRSPSYAPVCYNTQEGRTPVQLAEAAHHAEVVAALVQHGAVATPAAAPVADADDMGTPMGEDWHVLPRAVRAAQRTFTPFWEQLTQKPVAPPRRWFGRDARDEGPPRLRGVQDAAAAALRPLQLTPLLPPPPGAPPAKPHPRAWWAAALEANARVAVDLAVCGKWDALLDLLRIADATATKAAAARGAAGWLALHHAAAGGAPADVLRALLSAHPDGVEAVTDCLLEQRIGPRYDTSRISAPLTLLIWSIIVPTWCIFTPGMGINMRVVLAVVFCGCTPLLSYMLFSLTSDRECKCCAPWAHILLRWMPLTADYSWCDYPRQLPLQLSVTTDARRLLIWSAPHTVLSPQAARALVTNAGREAFSDALLSGGAALLRRRHFGGQTLLQLARRAEDAAAAEPTRKWPKGAGDAQKEDLAQLKAAHAALLDMHRLFRVSLLLADVEASREDADDAPYERRDGESADSVCYACNGQPVRLGGGTFGAVSLFRGMRPGSPGIAAKCITTARSGAGGTSDGRAAMQHLLRDAATLRGLEDRGVAQLLQVRLAPRDGVLLLVELAPGGDLHAAMLSQPHLTEWRACGVRLAAQVASALMYVLARGIYHHDVKTQNILLSDVLPAGRALLTDFGIAGDARHARSDRTGSGSWAAPETYSEEKAGANAGGMDWAAADVYSLGILCWHLLTKGVVPAKPGCFSPRSFSCTPCRQSARPLQLLRPDAAGSSVLLRCARCGVDECVSAAAPLVAAATAFDPGKRYKLEEVHAALHVQAMRCALANAA